MIEAMACGTPVIAFRRGSVPEVINEGVSGFVVDGIEDAVVAVSRLASLDRAEVRNEFERRFTAERMARDYVSLYEKVLSRRRLPTGMGGKTRRYARRTPINSRSIEVGDGLQGAFNQKESRVHPRPRTLRVVDRASQQHDDPTPLPLTDRKDSATTE